MTLLVLFVIALAAAFIAAAFFYLRHRVAQQVFPSHRVSRQPKLVPDTAESVWLQHKWGKTEVHFVAARKHSTTPSPAVIVAHGQLGIIDTWHPRLRPLTEAGFHYLLVEYPGYGDSEGWSNDSTLTDVMTASFDYLQQREDVETEQIFALGRSMGGGVVTRLLGLRPIKGICLMSTFTSLEPFLLAKKLPKCLYPARLNNLDALGRIALPTLIVHGTNDDVIPVSHGIELAKLGPHVHFVLEPGDHETTPNNWQDFWHLFIDFCRQNFENETKQKI